MVLSKYLVYSLQLQNYRTQHERYEHFFVQTWHGLRKRNIYWEHNIGKHFIFHLILLNIKPRIKILEKTNNVTKYALKTFGKQNKTRIGESKK